MKIQTSPPREPDPRRARPEPPPPDPEALADPARRLPPGTVAPADRFAALAPSAQTLAFAVYAAPHELRAALAADGATEVETVAARGVAHSANHAAVACLTDRRAWVACRGSDDADDWVDNFEVGRGDRHRGFSEGAAALLADLGPWLHRVRPEVDGVVVSGHSLGGALAVYVARTLAAAGWPVEAVVTVGAPPAGREAFATAYDAVPADGPGGPSLGAVTWRIVNDGDPVPDLPTSVGLRHVGQPASPLYPRALTGSMDAREQAEGVARAFQHIPLVPVLVKAWVLGDRAASHARGRYLPDYRSALGIPQVPGRVSFRAAYALCTAVAPRGAPSARGARLRVVLGVVALLVVAVVVGGAVWLTERTAPGMTILILLLLAVGLPTWWFTRDP